MAVRFSLSRSQGIVQNCLGCDLLVRTMGVSLFKCHGQRCTLGVLRPVWRSSFVLEELYNASRKFELDLANGGWAGARCRGIGGEEYGGECRGRVVGVLNGRCYAKGMVQVVLCGCLSGWGNAYFYDQSCRLYSIL